MKCFIHSADLITPQALEIMTEVKRRVLGDEPIEFDELPEDPPVGCTVFALGNYKATEDIGRVIPAPSVAQICTSPETVTRLGQAFQLLVDPPVLPKFEYTVLSYLTARAILTEARDSLFAVDLEWSGDDDLPDFKRVLGVGIYGASGVAFVIPEEIVPDLYQELKDFLEGNGIITVNGKGDLSYFPDAHVPEGAHFDCMLAHYALFPAASEHGLKPSTKRLFGFDDWDASTKQYRGKAKYETYEKFEDGSWHDAREYSTGSGFERIPRAMLYEYLGFDVYATWHWFVRLREMLAADADAMRVFKHLMRVQEMAMEWESSGYHLDVPYIENLSQELHVEKEQAEKKLNDIASIAINPRSPKQVKDWFAALGAAVAKTDEATMTEIIELTAPYRFNSLDLEETDDFHPGNTLVLAETRVDIPELLSKEERLRIAGNFAEQLLVCRGIAKTLGTYVDGYRKKADGEGRVRPGFSLTASTTGRIGGRGASLLTIPREKRLKKMVIPDPGHYMVGADLSQAELRVMAMESEDPWLIAAFQPGAGDFFDLLLGQAYPKEDWSTLHSIGGDSYNNKRAAMKGVVYGVSFGRGTRAISRALKIPEREAQILVDAFIRPGSPFDLWRDDITDRALNGKPIVTRFGRHFQSELVTYRNRQSVINSALAFTSQSTSNDICLLAALEATPKLREHGYRIISPLHDAIYTSGPEEKYEAAGTVLVECLQEAGRSVYGDAVSFDADWGHGRSMADV